jgi:hypothetical protein
MTRLSSSLPASPAFPAANLTWFQSSFCLSFLETEASLSSKAFCNKLTRSPESLNYGPFQT